MKDVCPHPFFRPAYKTIVERLMRPIDVGYVDPPPTALQDVDDPADDPSIINPGHAACIGRKKRLKPGELRLVEPEISVIYCRSAFGNLESQILPKGNPFYRSGV